MPLLRRDQAFAPHSLYPPRSSFGGTSGGLQCGLDGRKQSRVTERFEQEPRCTQLEHPSTNRVIFLRRYEYGWDIFTAMLQLLIKFRPTHTGHGDIENQTAGFMERIGRQNLFR